MRGERKKRLRVATIWLSGCSGCHMSLLYTDRFLLELAAAIDLVLSPLADGAEFPDGVDLVLIEGGIGTEHDRERALVARSKSRQVISLGDCAITGNVPSLGNQLDRGAVVREVYGAAWQSGQLPKPLASLLPVHQVIPVDLFIPGCPPAPERIRTVLASVIRGETPKLLPEMLTFG